MKPVLLLVVFLLLASGGAYYWVHRHEAPPPPGGKAAEARAEEKGDKDDARGKTTEEDDERSRLKHDVKGHVVVEMAEAAQRRIGLQTAPLSALQVPSELKAYGRVLDSAALSQVHADLAGARAAYHASSNEWVRCQTLAPQGNASERDLQKAEAAARHDQWLVQAAFDRLVAGWGAGVANHPDLPALVGALSSRRSVLVRLDLPAGESLDTAPQGARLTPLQGAVVEAEYLGAVSQVDPQTLTRGELFLVRTNTARLLASEPLIGFIRLPGPPVSGVLVPRDGIVRAEGAAWVYLKNAGGTSFTRLPVELTHPAPGGWCLTQGLTAGQEVVSVGAQALLSEELKASIAAD